MVRLPNGDTDFFDIGCFVLFCFTVYQPFSGHLTPN